MPQTFNVAAVLVCELYSVEGKTLLLWFYESCNSSIRANFLCLVEYHKWKDYPHLVLSSNHVRNSTINSSLLKFTNKPTRWKIKFIMFEFNTVCSKSSNPLLIWGASYMTRRDKPLWTLLQSGHLIMGHIKMMMVNSMFITVEMFMVYRHIHFLYQYQCAAVV